MLNNIIIPALILLIQCPINKRTTYTVHLFSDSKHAVRKNTVDSNSKFLGVNSKFPITALELETRWLPIRWEIQLWALGLWMKFERMGNNILSMIIIESDKKIAIDQLGKTVIGEEGLGSLLYGRGT